MIKYNIYEHTYDLCFKYNFYNIIFNKAVVNNVIIYMLFLIIPISKYITKILQMCLQ